MGFHPILLDGAVGADATGGLSTLIPGVGGAVGACLAMAYLFLRHLEQVHIRAKDTTDKAVTELATIAKRALEHDPPKALAAPKVA